MKAHLKSLLSIYLITVFTFVTSSIRAQETTFIIPDSLNNNTPKELIERITASESQELSVYEKTLLNNPDKDETIAKQYYRIAFHFYDDTNYKKAIQYFTKVIEVAKEPKDTNLLNVIYLNIGNAYKLLGEDAHALDFYYAFLELSQKQGNIDFEFIAYTNIAIIYRRMGQFKEALQKSLYALRFIDKTSDKNRENHVNNLTVISETYLDLKVYDSVIYYADKGLKISDSIEYTLGTVDLWIKKGIVFHEKEAYDKAFDYLFKAKNLLDTNQIKNSFNQYIYTNYFIASCFHNQEDYDKAITYLQKNIDLPKKEKSKETYLLNTYFLIAKAYQKTDQADNALYWYDEYTRLQNESKEDKNKIVTKIYEKETQEFKDEITLLKSNKEQSEQKAKYSMIIMIVISIALLFIVFTYFKKQYSNKALFNNLINKISHLESQKTIIPKTTKETTKEIVINDKKLERILKGLDKLEQQEFFLRSDCSLRTIAKKVKTNITYLSKIINTHKEKSFSDYINDLRINYALKRLKDDKQFRSFSVTSIATELGYKCDHSFAKHFKSKTDLYPSYYIKQLDKLNPIVKTPSESKE